MARVLARLGALSLVIAATVVGAAAITAQADAPQRQGWWTVANPGGVPINPTAVSDVPKDGLLVQAGPVNPTAPCNCTAYAGLVYELADGTTATDLTLKVDSQSATTPVATLELCPLVNATLTAEQGGPLSDAPDYNCKHRETASTSASATSFTFHVGSLVSNGILAVAILPADSTSRVVLDKPGSSSLTTTVAAPSGGTSFPTAPSTQPSTASSAGTSAQSAPAAAPQLPNPSTVGQPNSGQAPVVAPSPSTSPLAVAPVAATGSAGNGSKPIAVLILVAALVVGAALWTAAGRAPATENE